LGAACTLPLSAKLESMSASPCITTRLARSFAVPGARRAPRAAAARALHVPSARSARREPPHRTVRATSTHPILAIPRGTLPIELAVRADRLPRQARCSQQHDQSSSQHETTQHCTSRIAIYSPSGGWAAVSVPEAPRSPLPLPKADQVSEWLSAIFVASTAG